MSAPDAPAATHRTPEGGLLAVSWLPAVALLGLVLWGGEAGASEEGAALFAAARTAGRQGDVVAERRLCEELLADADATARHRSTCTARLAWLGERADADGDLDCLSTL